MATVEKLPMLAEGHAVLVATLRRLKEIERPEVVEQIEIARAHGDLSENAEYHAAKERQGQIEAQVIELEDRLARAIVIDPKTLSGNKVVFGATVSIEDPDSGERQTFAIVGEHEADIKAGRMAITAPVARALIGREIGDSMQVRTPKGQKEYEIVGLKFVALE